MGHSTSQMDKQCTETDLHDPGSSLENNIQVKVYQIVSISAHNDISGSKFSGTQSSHTLIRSFFTT